MKKSKPLFTRREISALLWAIQQAESWKGGIPDADAREEHMALADEARAVMQKARALRK